MDTVTPLLRRRIGRFAEEGAGFPQSHRAAVFRGKPVTPFRAGPDAALATSRDDGAVSLPATQPVLIVLVEERATVIGEALKSTRHSGAHYEAAAHDRIARRLEVLFDELLEAVSSRDLCSIIEYARQLAKHRFRSGYDLSEVQGAINAIEEATWSVLCTRLEPDQLALALGLISTALGAAKDALAREYVSLATQTHAPSIDMRALFTGTEAGGDFAG